MHQAVEIGVGWQNVLFCLYSAFRARGRRLFVPFFHLFFFSRR